MRPSTLALAAVLVVPCATVPAWAGPPAGDQRVSAAQIVPPGFKVTMDTDIGAAFAFEATRPNDACPKPHQDPGILIRGGRTPNPAAAVVVDMMAEQPEDPASRMGMSRDEPLGRERYKGGVLSWRKSTIPWIGAGEGPDMVMISGEWAGPGEGTLLSLSVNRFCGSKEAARAWLDGMIDRLTAAK